MYSGKGFRFRKYSEERFLRTLLTEISVGNGFYELAILSYSWKKVFAQTLFKSCFKRGNTNGQISSYPISITAPSTRKTLFHLHCWPKPSLLNRYHPCQTIIQNTTIILRSPWSKINTYRALSMIISSTSSKAREGVLTIYTKAFLN